MQYHLKFRMHLVLRNFGHICLNVFASSLVEFFVVSNFIRVLGNLQENNFLCSRPSAGKPLQMIFTHCI
ncbi:MAG: hypothetical protein DWH95_13640 [Planctomycetota bacterium]|nr:MAG: hypothetical protein DWH95_13640 [Planctomycetota bacterium]